MPGAQRPQKSVDQAKPCSQQAAGNEPDCPDFRRRHPISRRSQPPCRGSS